jgi:hypothetical protein
MPYQINFKQLAEDIDIEAVADLLNLKIIKGRVDCPACDSERALEFFPETNTLACYAAPAPPGKKNFGGDLIQLYAHCKGYQGMYRAAKEIAQHFGANAPTVQGTHPTSPEARPAQVAQPAPFDPQAFAAKLAYSPEIEAMGLSEENATKLSIGFYRKKIYLAVRNDDGSIAGFAEFSEGNLRLPDKWLKPTNVVPIKKVAR